MAKPRLVRPELTEEDVKAVLGTGSYNISELERQSPFSRQQIKRMRDDLVEKGIIPKRKINLPSRANLNLIPVDPPAIEPPAPAPAKPKPVQRPVGRRLLAGGCLLTAVAFAAANAYMNANFGASFGQGAANQFVLGAVNLTVDFGSLVLLAVAAYFREDKRHTLLALALLIWALCVVYSACSALGYTSNNVGDSLQGREAVANHRTALMDQANRVKTDRIRITETRDPQILEQMIQTARGSIPSGVLKSSKDCADITLPLSLAACDHLLQLRSAKRAAEQRNELDKKLGSLSDEIAALPPVSAKDPGAEQISQMAFGKVTAEQVRSYLVRCLALIMSISPGPLLAFVRALLR